MIILHFHLQLQLKNELFHILHISVSNNCHLNNDEDCMYTTYLCSPFDSFVYLQCPIKL